MARRSGDFRRHAPSATFILAASLIFAASATVFIYFGIYNIGADSPHSSPVYWAVKQLRDQSIASRSRNIAVPVDLDDPKRRAVGAGLYAEMCSGCHLGPGLEKSEMSQGLYPKAPELAVTQAHSPSQQFWMIKHGVKLSAMPAWGVTHSDTLIWDMVAFVRTLPKLTPAEYEAAIKSAPAGHDAMMKSMSGMKGISVDSTLKQK